MISSAAAESSVDGLGDTLAQQVGEDEEGYSHDNQDGGDQHQEDEEVGVMLLLVEEGVDLGHLVLQGGDPRQNKR